MKPRNLLRPFAVYFIADFIASFLFKAAQRALRGRVGAPEAPAGGAGDKPISGESPASDALLLPAGVVARRSVAAMASMKSGDCRRCGHPAFHHPEDHQRRCIEPGCSCERFEPPVFEPPVISATDMAAPTLARVQHVLVVLGDQSDRNVGVHIREAHAGSDLVIAVPDEGFAHCKKFRYGRIDAIEVAVDDRRPKQAQQARRPSEPTEGEVEAAARMLYLAVGGVRGFESARWNDLPRETREAHRNDARAALVAAHQAAESQALNATGKSDGDDGLESGS